MVHDIDDKIKESPVMLCRSDVHQPRNKLVLDVFVRLICGDVALAT